MFALGRCTERLGKSCQDCFKRRFPQHPVTDLIDTTLIRTENRDFNLNGLEAIVAADETGEQSALRLAMTTTTVRSF